MPDNNARSLRKNPTDAEQKLWSRLRKRQLENFRFRRQCPIGPYIIDFTCLDKDFLIELDGSQHHEPDHILYDNAKTDWLNCQGYFVLRFNNNEIFENMEGVLRTIYLHLKDR